MFVEILISAAVLILLSGIVLAIKYYKQKSWPLCRAFGKKSKDYKNKVACGAKTFDDSAKNNHNTQNN